MNIIDKIKKLLGFCPSRCEVCHKDFDWGTQGCMGVSYITCSCGHRQKVAETS